MTREELLKAVELTDDKYIAEAAVPPKKKVLFGFNGAKAVFAAAACLAVFLFAGIILKNGVTPTHTDSPTTNSLSASGTEEPATEKERTATEKTTQHTETTEVFSDEPTEAPSAVITEITTEPLTVEPSGEAAEPTKINDSPTAPTQAPTDEQDPQCEPPTEENTTEAEQPHKTVTEILTELGLFSESPAGEGELLEAPGKEQTEQVFTELTWDELTEIFGFSPSEKILAPEGFIQEAAAARKTEHGGNETVSALYAYAKETDTVILSLQKGDTAFSPELFGTQPVIINGTDVYIMTEYGNETGDLPEQYRSCLAVFLHNGLRYVLWGQGVTVTPDELMFFISSLIDET